MPEHTLRFECQSGCTRCCDQQGMVYLSENDLRRAAEFVGMSPRAFERKYVYRTAHQMRFRKPPEKQCPFLEDYGCSIHTAKPTQCRTFPFWPEIVESREAWKRTGKFCPGIGKGPLIQIGTAMEIAEQQRREFPEDYR
jgi:Fe-S-cluster containining protein